MSLSSVAVIMSTYNGAEHVKEQIDSLLAQDAPNVSIYVRDDGSKDDTCKILREYQASGLINLEEGGNLGVVRSFLAVLDSVPAKYEFIALCDQDDVWHTDKLSRALEVLSTKDSSIPQLYCSEYNFCDAKMNFVERSHLNRSGVDFPKMLFENMVSGNTTVINHCLANLVLQAGADGVYCHDWWLALVATALGDLTYDDFASLEYRRTGANVSPTGSDALHLLVYRIKTFFGKGELENITLQLHKLEDCFGNQLSPEKRDLLERSLNGDKLSKITIPCRLRQKMSEEIALRLLFLFGVL